MAMNSSMPFCRLLCQFILLGFLAPPGSSLRTKQEKETSCSPLKNHETFSTITVKVGTPPQAFDLVADTGSDDVIVQSCVCKEQHSCPAEFGKCFRGKEASSTFSLSQSLEPNHQGPLAILMSFGSGQIAAVEATDVVQVGLESAVMNNSLLLMVKQALKISGTFEGILGLGRPHQQVSLSKQDISAPTVRSFMDLAHVRRFAMCFNYGADGVLGLNTAQRPAPMGSVGQLHWGLDFRGISAGDASQPVSFCSPESKKPGMETACGLIPDSGTTLMMGPAEHIHSLYSDLCSKWERCRNTHAGLVSELAELKKSGQLHISGLYLEQDGQRTFLRDKGMEERVLAEAAVASDETQEPQPVPSEEEIQARQEVLQRLKDMLKAAGTAKQRQRAGGAGDEQKIDMSYTFQMLLMNCNQWLVNSTNLNEELPSVFFHVAGSAGGQDTLEMKPNSYVVEMKAQIAHRQMKKLMGMIPVEIISVSQELVCQPAFGVMDYPTQLNGPVWIMGTPLFYEYQVHYDRESAPPSMNIVREPCGSCVGSEYKKSTSLLGANTTVHDRRLNLRRITSDPLVREIDTTLPL